MAYIIINSVFEFWTIAQQIKEFVHATLSSDQK